MASVANDPVFAFANRVRQSDECCLDNVTRLASHAAWLCRDELYRTGDERSDQQCNLVAVGGCRNGRLDQRLR